MFRHIMALVLASVPTIAAAAVVDVTSSGTIEARNYAFPFVQGFAGGTEYSFSTSYDTDTAPFKDAGNYLYYRTKTPLVLTIAGRTYTSTLSTVHLGLGGVSGAEFPSLSFSGEFNSIPGFYQFSAGMYGVPGTIDESKQLPTDASRYMRRSYFQLWQSNHSKDAGYTWALSESSTSFQLTPASAVPESSTWAMIVLGFAAIGFAIRRGNHRRPSRFTVLRAAS